LNTYGGNSSLNKILGKKIGYFLMGGPPKKKIGKKIFDFWNAASSF
jgi:hypothetical protein